MRIHSFTSLLILTPLILHTYAFALQLSWPWPISSSSARRYKSGEHRGDSWIDLLRSRELPGISASEVESLFLNMQSLNSYSHKPDCFKRAAGRIRSFCGDFDSDGMNEDERIHAAITMTLCEINTALQPPPLECVPFSSVLPVEDHASHWDNRSDKPRHERNSYTSCVSALSRSPQSWSSYSGYLREVPQLCHAFRRWNDIDTARKIYTNITLEKLSFLRHLHLREERWEEGMGAWVVVVKDLQDVMQSLTRASANREEVVDQFGRGFDETLIQFRQSLASIQTQEEVGYRRSLSRVDEELTRVINRHDQTLLTLIPTLEHTLSSYLTEVLVRNAEIFEFGVCFHLLCDPFGLCVSDTDVVFFIEHSTRPMD
ncbi:hypothetical protein PILCRDRAFT_345617 [Piloderma croceum F 1598]|uniref:Karyogamy protein 5 n=1 Tax=Piloderma croceum (strain F 1598) TaxID=765440 RepID=A0A0C3FPA7_PILCF|nr:hypothetical protein PILCRDRAFT_345617 [Piloderma croceum F 1598]